MPRPTLRGLALLGLGLGAYFAGRVVGTWELYLFAFAFVAAVIVSWLLVIATGRRINVTRVMVPDRPVAGDEPELRMLVENTSLLPGPQLTLRSPLAELGPDDLEQEIESLSPRGRATMRSPLSKVNRGVHHLPAVRAIAEDPLGIASVVRRVGPPLRVTVHPRIVPLDSCALYPHMGLRPDWSGDYNVPVVGGFEFRGIRPHQPGEPLSHVDWKSTAKTGILMLRETEEPAGAQIAVLLDGTAGNLVGTAPNTNFELAVRIAGSLGDYALRAGRSVALLSHERELKRLRLTSDGSGRGKLLEALAEAQPTAAAPLAHSLRRLRRESARLLHAQSVTVVALSLDHELVRTLVSLREEGVRLSLAYVVSSTFAERGGADGALLPFLPARHPTGAARAGQRAHSDRNLLSAEERSGLLSLASVGIPSLTVARGDDLVQALSTGRSRTRREAARG